MTTKCAELGSISSGTMRTEDLLPAFTGELESLLEMQPRSFKRAEYRALIREANRVDDFDGAEAQDTMERLFDALGDFAPPGAYFGAHEGDGADYGFWPIE